MEEKDHYWMAQALEIAQEAAALGEVPVGAILVHENQLIAKAGNRRETLKSPLAHAELICVEEAAKKMDAWRLSGTTLYVTLEPCVMCSGALVQSRIQRLVYGAKDPKGGGISSLYQIANDTRLNHRIEVVSGVMEKECGEILSNFFRARRAEKK